VCSLETLADYLRENPEGYRLSECGTIRDPGKFEGEPLWLPYFHARPECALESHGSVDENDYCADVFELSDEERAAHSDLEGVYTLRVIEDSQGFVTSEEFGEGEYDSSAEPCYADCEEVDADEVSP
jgi:hypothetical protein